MSDASFRGEVDRRSYLKVARSQRQTCEGSVLRVSTQRSRVQRVGPHDPNVAKTHLPCKNSRFKLDSGPRAVLAGSSATTPGTNIVQTDHKKLAQKYEANSASVGDNTFITGRRGLLPPSYPRRPSSFSRRGRSTKRTRGFLWASRFWSVLWFGRIIDLRGQTTILASETFDRASSAQRHLEARARSVRGAL